MNVRYITWRLMSYAMKKSLMYELYSDLNQLVTNFLKNSETLQTKIALEFWNFETYPEKQGER